MSIKQAIEALPPLPEPDSFCTHADAHEHDVFTAEQMREYALAALRSMPAEPVAVLHDDGYWTPCDTEAGRALNSRLMHAGSRETVYATPQPAAPKDALDMDALPHEETCDWWRERMICDCKFRHRFATPQPAAKPAPCIACGEVGGHKDGCARVRWGVVAQAEPVARDGWREAIEYAAHVLKSDAGQQTRWATADSLLALLAASPTQPRPQPQPLTERELNEAWNRAVEHSDPTAGNAHIRYGRAIEAAHGITAQEPTE